MEVNMSQTDPYQPVVDAWKRNLVVRGGCVLDVGKAAHTALRKRLKGVYDPGSRRSLRAETVDTMVDRIARAGMRVSGSELNRAVSMYHVAQLYDPKAARQLPITTLRSFCATIKRDAAKEEWLVKPKTEDACRALWARVIEGQVEDVAEQVRVALGKPKPKPRQPKPKPSVVEQVKKLLPQLSEENRRALYIALSREFGSEVKVTPMPQAGAEKQVSIPMGTPPGQAPSAEVAETPDANEQLGIRERLLGRRRAG